MISLINPTSKMKQWPCFTNTKTSANQFLSKTATIDGVGRRGCTRKKWEDSMRLGSKDLALSDDKTSDR